MKIQHKSAAIMAFLSALIILILSSGYFYFSQKLIMEKGLNSIENLSNEIALQVESSLIQNTITSDTLSLAPLIKNSLLKSNADFSLFSDSERKQEISTLNSTWKNITDINDPFIQSYMTNSLAKYFKLQQQNRTGTYGEIFLTNRYGVMIATTGKLTTLAHAYKYWWKAAFNKEKGKTFLDDRGFDLSVEGYVLGVVIPIMHQDEVIGILKCNMNITGFLDDIINKHERQYPSKIKIVRTNGKIVFEHGVEPLSTKVNTNILGLLGEKESSRTVVNDDYQTSLIGVSPIKLTNGDGHIGFGGKLKSLGHIKGNTGQGWDVVATLNKKYISSNAFGLTKQIILFGMVFTIFTTIIALLIGKIMSAPLVDLSNTARNLGKGDLSVRSSINSRDEIGFLATTINKMAQKVQETRDGLVKEILNRKKIEKELERISLTDELTGVYNRRAFNDFMHKNISRAKRHDEPLSILMLDIDYFKQVNDSYGHDMGDQVLIILVHLAKDHLREEDIFARWGGEEFIILLPQTNSNEALNLAERIRKNISDHDFPKIGLVTVSIGHTELHTDDSSDTLLKRVDEALYQAKSGGRNNVSSC